MKWSDISESQLEIKQTVNCKTEMKNTAVIPCVTSQLIYYVNNREISILKLTAFPIISQKCSW